jgi:PHYB activation tagged suppressor 1
MSFLSPKFWSLILHVLFVDDAGERFLYWYGIEAMIVISDVELVKEVLTNKFGFYPKRQVRPSTVTMIGEGLALVEGVEWVKRRRIFNPAFSMDKLKVLFTN